MTTGSNISHERVSGLIGGGNGLHGKLYPNGEVVVYRPRVMKLKGFTKSPDRAFVAHRMARLRLCLTEKSLEVAIATIMGLSLLPNFDKLLNVPVISEQKIIKPSTRNGLRGITSYGARRVRNACHLLEADGGRRGVVFATCTVPDLPLEAMSLIHEGWNKVVEAYRRKLTRMLQGKGLSGESTTVSEVQEKRYQKTGLPVLHIHTVFCGKTASGQWAFTTEEHDQMWREALEIVAGVALGALSSACNLQRVKKSAEGYLGKYMTKGVKAVAALIENGFAGWVPRQWWSASRSLTRRIDCETRDIERFADWLYDVADSEGRNIWVWHRDIVIERDCGFKTIIARYGRLSRAVADELREYINESRK